MAEDDARYRSHPRSCPEEFHGTGQRVSQPRPARSIGTPHEAQSRFGQSVDRYECDVRALAVCSGCRAQDEADLTECDLRQAFLNGARPTLRGNRGSARRRARGIHTLPIVGGGAGDGYETDRSCPIPVG